MEELDEIEIEIQKAKAFASSLLRETDEGYEGLSELARICKWVDMQIERERQSGLWTQEGQNFWFLSLCAMAEEAKLLGNELAEYMIVFWAQETSSLVGLAYALGSRHGVARGTRSAVFAATRKNMSTAKSRGRKGAQRKHQPTRELKQWALSKAESMRGSDIELARKLAAQLPVFLADASDAPERLIYDALRARRKTEK